mgnify:CR=1 FL=1
MTTQDSPDPFQEILELIGQSGRPDSDRLKAAIRGILIAIRDRDSILYGWNEEKQSYGYLVMRKGDAIGYDWAGPQMHDALVALGEYQ